MLPTLIEIPTSFGPMAVHTYGLLVTAAFCAAFVYIHVRVRQIGIMPDRMLGTYLAAFVGGLLGARILYVVAVETEAFLANPLSVFAFTGGGFAIYGGIVGGAVAVVAYLVSQKLPIWKLGDIIWPAVLLGMGIGRLGCFFAGCCHGVVAHGFEGASVGLPGGEVWFSSGFPFLATEFHSGAGNVTRLTDTPLYPTQLWAAATGIGASALLAWLWTKRQFDGQILALGLLIEPPFRILIEGFRSDHRGYVFTWPISESMVSWFPGMSQAGSSLEGPVMGLTTSQTIGVLFIAVGAVIYYLRHDKGVAEEQELGTGEDGDDLLLAADIPD